MIIYYFDDISTVFGHSLTQGLEPYRKEPVLKPEPFEYWEPEPYRNS